MNILKTLQKYVRYIHMCLFFFIKHIRKSYEATYNNNKKVGTIKYDYYMKESVFFNETFA